MPSASIGNIEGTEALRRVHVSVPARTEVSGNHQDHQGGCVIAAAVDRRIKCAATSLLGNRISVSSANGESFEIDMGSPDFAFPHEGEYATSKAIVRGMAARLIERGVNIPGCRLSFSSDIPIGMGLSSSAAFELCVGAAFLALSGEGLEDGKWEPLDMAKVAMHVEQDYFGKPCGLMDQATCALGGVVYMDFALADDPAIAPLHMPAEWAGYEYLLVSTGEGHEDLTSDYANVAEDMRMVARFLGVGKLRDLTYADYLAALPCVRGELGDAAALRALGFYAELSLVERRLCALREGDMKDFIRMTERSGVCSAEYLQNVSHPGQHEPAMAALALCRCALQEAVQKCGGDQGSARIHGGGFGGTIQVILPVGQSRCFEERIEELMGFDCCMHVRLGVPGIEICDVNDGLHMEACEGV